MIEKILIVIVSIAAIIFGPFIIGCIFTKSDSLDSFMEIWLIGLMILIVLYIFGLPACNWLINGSV